MEKVKWGLIYGIVGAGSLTSYFITRSYLITTGVTSFILSNVTLNLLLLTMIWGAFGPWWLRRKPFVIKWGGVLVGFVLILLLLTVTGTHTRILDLFYILGGKK